MSIQPATAQEHAATAWQALEIGVTTQDPEVNSVLFVTLRCCARLLSSFGGLAVMRVDTSAAWRQPVWGLHRM